MPFYLGSTKVGSIYLGSVKIGTAYLGSTNIYSSGNQLNRQPDTLRSEEPTQNKSDDR